MWRSWMKKKPKELTLDQLKSSRTILYDCSLDLRIEIPRDNDDRININWIYRITLLAMAHELCSKHPDGQDLIRTIYLILKKTTAATKRNFKVVKKSKGTRLALERKKNESGHFLEGGTVPPFYETIKYSGKVDDDYHGTGPITVSCNIKLFMCPSVQAAEDIYEDHDFPVVTYKDKDYEDPEEIIEWCGDDLDEHENQTFNVGQRWGWLCYPFEENQEYHAQKRRRFDSPERDLWDDEDDEDEDDYRY